MTALCGRAIRRGQRRITRPGFDRGAARRARELQDDVGITLTRRAQRSGTSTMAAESQICRYRRVSLLPGLRVNLSKSGASLSIGRRGIPG